MATIDSTNTSTAASEPIDDADRPFLTPQRIRVLSIGAGVVVLAALVVWFVVTAGRRKEAYAATALEQARQAAAQQNYGVAVQGFTRIKDTYSGTAAAYEANIGIAKARLVAGQNELAISSLTDFLKTNPPATYASPANNLLGTAYENTDKFSDAEAAYRKASDLATVEYLKASSLLDAARAAKLAGKPDDAKSIYQQILTKYPKTGAKGEAEVRLAELNAATGT
jgi:tetratricopeptide (TPR) repeat protein